MTSIEAVGAVAIVGIETMMTAIGATRTLANIKNHPAGKKMVMVTIITDPAGH